MHNRINQSQLEAIFFVTLDLRLSTEGRNRTHIDGFGDRFLTIRRLP